MRRWSAEEIAYHDRVVALRNARRAEVNAQVAANWAERSGGFYRVADRAVGQTDEALAASRGAVR